jgi:FCD domain.
LSLVYKNNGDADFLYNHHRKIYEAIKNHDPLGAEEAMQCLLDQGADVLNDYLNDGEEFV